MGVAVGVEVLVGSGVGVLVGSGVSVAGGAGGSVAVGAGGLVGVGVGDGPLRSRAMPRGVVSPVTTSSMAEPSRLARWTLLVESSVQYILPAATSSAMSLGTTPVDR